ncbi:Cycloartenol synthase [Platanthera zijinensis]|uniref:Cycloartenol synthase n=1 Tax=Platanthera zijinensis TaxID=2320716 RepID=A0AAP0BD01_9ASPA
MFGSILAYITLRLLDQNAEGGAMQKGRNWILAHGGVTYITLWWKFLLSILGLFNWYGNNPLPPKILLFPCAFPIHPGQMWCHCRMVYIPMSYLYGKRFVGPIIETDLPLRKELYIVPYDEIDWNLARNLCAMSFPFYPHPLTFICVRLHIRKIVVVTISSRAVDGDTWSHRQGCRSPMNPA